VLACLLLPKLAKEERLGVRERRLDFAFPVLIFALTIGLAWFANNVAPLQMSGAIYVVAPPLFVSYPLRKRPMRFALALGGVLLAAGLMTGMSQNVLRTERNFFGVVRVVNDTNRHVHSFLHGNTVHGRQSTITERRCETLAYYHKDGPHGRIFAQIEKSRPAANNGVMGLGIGGPTA
jgi:hypothetical protein